MEKIKKTIHEDEFEYSRSIFDPVYSVLGWVNRELESRGVELQFDLNVLDDYEEDEDD